MRNRDRRRYSGFRLAQTCWIITSVYFALLIGETTKDGLLPSVSFEGVDWARLLISISTLAVCFVSATEAYLWLNPRKDERLGAPTAAFRAIHLLLYVIAVILHAFMYQPLRSDRFDHESLRAWCIAVSSLLIVYIAYNLVWVLKRTMIERAILNEDKDCPAWPDLVLYLSHYAFFAVVFAFYAIAGTKRTDRTLAEMAVCAVLLLGAYFLTYFAIWWRRWHRGAIETRYRSLY